MSRGERNSAWPPSCQVPTSNDTRVRVEAFMKIMASDFPASGFRSYFPVRMRSPSSKSFSSSLREKSGIARKSRCGRSAGIESVRKGWRGRGATARATALEYVLPKVLVLDDRLELLADELRVHDD